jgi:hypothetical protein
MKPMREIEFTQKNELIRLLNTDVGLEGSISEPAINSMVDEIHADLGNDPSANEDNYDQIFNDKWAERLLKCYVKIIVRTDKNVYGIIDDKEIIILNCRHLSHVFEDAEWAKK